MALLASIKSFLREWSDAWVLLTAIGTIALAIATFRIIRQGQKLREDAEQHRKDTERQHRDRLKPTCVLTPYDYVDSFVRRGKLIDVISPSPDNQSFGRVKINCTLQNVGMGPALNLRLTFRFPSRAGWTSDPWELLPIGAGEKYGNLSAPIVVPIQLAGAFNETDFGTIKDDLWKIILEYEDLFGTKFQSLHSKAPFDMNPSTFKWTTPKHGEQPKAIMNVIPCFSYIQPEVS